MTYNELREIINPIYEKLTESQKFEDCGRCIGKGYIRGFSHIKGGVCFRCGGTKRLPANLAARRKIKIYDLMRSIKREKQFGAEDITILKSYKDLMDCIEKLPKKYKVKS